MKRRFDLPERIALFPLPRAVLLPRAKLPLHIFEPRYLQMLEDALKTDHRLIGMIQPQEGGLAEVGNAGRVIAFSESDDGRMMISLRAISRFRIFEVEEGFTPYMRGRIDWTGFDKDLGATEEDRQLDRAALIDKLRRYAGTHELETNWEAVGNVSDEALINSFAMILPFSSGDKQALLEAVTLQERRELLEGLLEFAHHGGDKKERMQ